MESLGFETSQLGPFADSLSAFASTLVENPTAEQTTEIFNKLLELNRTAANFVFSQPGFGNFMDIVSDSRNAEFVVAGFKNKMMFEEIMLNPKNAKKLVTLEFSERFARYLVSTKEISNRNIAEASSSECLTGMGISQVTIIYHTCDKV
jgi:hypothetical protein